MPNWTADDYYRTYREGLIKRHLGSNGRFVQELWLVEQARNPPAATGAARQAWDACMRVSTEEDLATGGPYSYRAYPASIMHQNAARKPKEILAGGGDNPLLYGGLAMAAFAMETLLDVSTHALTQVRRPSCSLRRTLRTPQTAAGQPDRDVGTDRMSGQVSDI